jgi:hypothetical protein
MCRHLLAIAVVCGLLAFVVVGGCSRVTTVTFGGAKGSKADQARKQAEDLALNVVNGIAKSQAKAVPELTQSGKNSQPGKSTMIVSTGVSKGTVISPNDDTPVKTPVPTPAAPSTPQSVSSSSSPKMTAVKDFMSPKSSPRPGSPAIIKERVVSAIPYANKAEAEDDAFTSARDAIERRLAELDPPVRYRPSLNEIRNEFARKDSQTTHRPSQAELEEYAKNSVNEKVIASLVYVECDVEVTADQIRELRTRDRVTITLRVFSGLIFIALSGFLFLRADEWTKGYLTRWLACAAVVLVGGAAAALYFV